MCIPWILFGAWFQISANYDMYGQYRIGFRSTRYDLSRIISADITDDIADMANIIDIDDRYCQY